MVGAVMVIMDVRGIKQDDKGAARLMTPKLQRALVDFAGMRPELEPAARCATRVRPCRCADLHAVDGPTTAIGTSIRALDGPSGDANACSSSRARSSSGDGIPRRRPPERRPQQPLPVRAQTSVPSPVRHPISTGVRTIDGPAPPSSGPGPVRAPAPRSRRWSRRMPHMRRLRLNCRWRIPCAYSTGDAVGRPACAGRSRAGETSSAGGNTRNRSPARGFAPQPHRSSCAGLVPLNKGSQLKRYEFCCAPKSDDSPNAAPHAMLKAAVENGLGSMIDRRVVTELIGWLVHHPDVWQTHAVMFSVNLTSTHCRTNTSIKFVGLCWRSRRCRKQ